MMFWSLLVYIALAFPCSCCHGHPASVLNMSVSRCRWTMQRVEIVAERRV